MPNLAHTISRWRARRHARRARHWPNGCETCANLRADRDDAEITAAVRRRAGAPAQALFDREVQQTLDNIAHHEAREHPELLEARINQFLHDAVWSGGDTA